MKLFKGGKRSVQTDTAAVYSASRGSETADFPNSVDCWEKELYDRLRFTVPVIDAAIGKIVRLTGGYRIICSDEGMQETMDYFVSGVPVGLTGVLCRALQTAFLKVFLHTETR